MASETIGMEDRAPHESLIRQVLIGLWISDVPKVARRLKEADASRRHLAQTLRGIGAAAHYPGAGPDGESGIDGHTAVNALQVEAEVGTTAEDLDGCARRHRVDHLDVDGRFERVGRAHASLPE